MQKEKGDVMQVNGTLINYYFHCKRQCYLAGNRLNMEENSEDVQIGRVLHEIELEHSKTHEIAIDNIRLDKITDDYLVEIKKSDADLEATRWQVLFYLHVLKQKGIIKKGKIEVLEKKKQSKKVHIVELTDALEEELTKLVEDIQNLIYGDTIPDVIHEPTCKKCAYYSYCYL